MKRYHVNPDTGRSNICYAKKRCRFAVDGVEPPHYTSPLEAQAAGDKMLAERYGGSFGGEAKRGRSRKSNTATVVKPKPQIDLKEQETNLEREISGENENFNPEFVESQLDMMTEDYKQNEEKKELAELEKLKAKQEESKGLNGIRQRWDRFTERVKLYSEEIKDTARVVSMVAAPVAGFAGALGLSGTSVSSLGAIPFFAGAITAGVLFYFHETKQRSKLTVSGREKHLKHLEQKNENRRKFKQENQKRKAQEQADKKRIEELESKHSNQLEA